MNGGEFALEDPAMLANCTTKYTLSIITSHILFGLGTSLSLVNQLRKVIGVIIETGCI
jgi:hypothetical protein